MKRLKVKFTLEAAGIVRKLHPDTKGIIKSGILEIQESPHVGHQLQAELYGFMSHKLIELHAAQAPALRERFHKSKIRNLKSQIMANDSIGIKTG